MELELKKNYKRFLFLVPLVLFVIDMILVSNNKMVYIDNFVYNCLISFKSDTFTRIVIMITEIGSFKGIVVVICFLLLYKRDIGVVGLCLSVLQQIINRLIKALIQRPRPSIEHLVNESNYSFPSGHAMAITCLYGLLIYYLSISNYCYRKLLMVVCGIIIVLVMLSRVYLGVHYFSDVLGGFLLSCTLLLLFINKP